MFFLMLTILISNLKGDFFNSTPGFRFIILIYVLYWMHHKLVPKGVSSKKVLDGYEYKEYDIQYNNSKLQSRKIS